MTNLKGLVVIGIKERDQITIFEHIKQKIITQAQAANILRLSVRQIKKKFKRYLKQGVDGLIHKSRGRASHRGITEDIKTKMLEMLKNKRKRAEYSN